MFKLNESSIDFPQPGLSPLVWDKEGDSYVLKPNLKLQLIDHLDSYKAGFFRWIGQDVRIVGSICTNTYTDDSDIDIHISPDIEKLQQVIGNKEPEEEVREVFKFFRDRNILLIGEHPVEVYLQLNPKQDIMMSDGVYDFRDDEWQKGPLIKNISHNPYEEFKGALDQVKNVAKEADLDIAELKRDLIDYETIEKAIKQFPQERKEQLLDTLKGKLQEIEDDINDLYSDRLEWIKMRRKASQPQTDEDEMEDIRVASNFAEKNALFKFMNRFGYHKLISSLEKQVGKEVDDSEIDKIKSILGK